MAFCAYARTAMMALFGLPLCAPDVLAYRPFDSTDAAVADQGTFEVEASPLSFEHGDDGPAWIAPGLRLNYGFAESWEVVLEGQVQHFRHADPINDAELSLKTVLRDGSLQEKSGASLAAEGSILLPGIGADDGVGLEVTAIASQRWDWGTLHFNLAPILTREGRGGVFTGAILEGPDDWTVRPVAELSYEHDWGRVEEYSGLIGLVWKKSDHMAFDLAYRHADINQRPDEQIRAGLTFDF